MPHRRRELDRVLSHVPDLDHQAWVLIDCLAAKVPFGSIAKIRESVEYRHRVGPGYVINALKGELGRPPTLLH